MNSLAPRPAFEKRQLAKRAAAEMGIDDAYIRLFVDTFYQRIRKDPRLNPIFDEAIGNRWELHLPKMSAFWGAIVFSDGRYSGNPTLAHKRLIGVTPSDFAIWLGLLRDTLDETAPTAKARDFLMQRATRIAESLQRGMFDRNAEKTT